MLMRRLLHCVHTAVADPATGQDVKVYTMDGRQFSLPLRQGITSVGEIRAFVAQKENAPVEKVCYSCSDTSLRPFCPLLQ